MKDERNKGPNSNESLRHLHRFFVFLVRHGGGAFQFVPRERLSGNSAQKSLKQHQRKQLAISEALQPHLTEQPRVFPRIWGTPLECEGDRRCNEINNQKCCEEDHQPLETRGIGRSRMKMLLHYI